MTLLFVHPSYTPHTPFIHESRPPAYTQVTHHTDTAWSNLVNSTNPLFGHPSYTPYTPLVHESRPPTYKQSHASNTHAGGQAAGRTCQDHPPPLTPHPSLYMDQVLLHVCTSHNTTHCNTLQHTATHCNTLQHTATHCSTLQHTTTTQSSYMYARRTLQHTVQHTIQNTTQHATQHTESKDHPTPQALVHIHESRPPAYTQSRIIHYMHHIPTKIHKITHHTHTHITHTHTSHTHTHHTHTHITHHTHTQEAKPQKVLPTPPSPQCTRSHTPPPSSYTPPLLLHESRPLTSHISKSHNTTHTGGQTAESAATTTSLHTPQPHPRANLRLVHHMATGTISRKSALRSFYIGNIVVSSLLRNFTRAQIRENYTAWQAQFLKSQLCDQFTYLIPS